MRRSTYSIQTVVRAIRKAVHEEMLDKSVQMLLAEIPGVRLGESLWDVSLFLFYKPLGLVVNLTTLLLLVVTIFSQLVSLLVVFRLHETVRDHGASLQSDFALWRRATDPETVHAVCNRNASLSSSFLQASTYDTHNGYTESFFGESPVFFVGTATSCLLCSAWVVTVLKKLGCVVDHVFVNVALDAESMHLYSSGHCHFWNLPVPPTQVDPPEQGCLVLLRVHHPVRDCVVLVGCRSLVALENDRHRRFAHPRRRARLHCGLRRVDPEIYDSVETLYVDSIF